MYLRHMYAQPSGAATPRNSDAHKRIAVPKALCVLWEHPRPSPKSGKVCLSDTRLGDIRERAACSEGNDTPPSETPRVSPRKPLCVRLGAEVACVPAFTRESERGAFVREVEKLFEIELWRQFCRLFLVC